MGYRSQRGTYRRTRRPFYRRINRGPFKYRNRWRRQQRGRDVYVKWSSNLTFDLTETVPPSPEPVRARVGFDTRWTSEHDVHGVNMWNAYHQHYLKWLRISISDIIIQAGHAEEIEIKKLGSDQFTGHVTALHHLNNQYLLGIWDKYDVIKDNNHPIFDDWRRFQPGTRKPKTLIYVPVKSKKPVIGWDWKDLIKLAPSFKSFLNQYGQPGMGDYNFETYFTTPDSIKMYQNEVAKTYKINVRITTEQKWRCYNSSKWSLRKRDNPPGPHDSLPKTAEGKDFDASG